MQQHSIHHHPNHQQTQLAYPPPALSAPTAGSGGHLQQQTPPPQTAPLQHVMAPAGPTAKQQTATTNFLVSAPAAAPAAVYSAVTSDVFPRMVPQQPSKRLTIESSAVDTGEDDTREFDRPSSSAAPSPLPSGFMDTTQIIFKSLIAQTPNKLLKIDEVAKYGSVDEQLNQTYVIQTPFHERLSNVNPLSASPTEMLTDVTKRGGYSLLFGSQDNYGLDELSTDTRSISIDPKHPQQQQQVNKSTFPLSASSVMVAETPKSSHQTTATRTVVADSVEESMSKSPELTSPTVQIPMGHLNDAEFKQLHEEEMGRAIGDYGEALQQYTDKFKRYHEEKKRVLRQIEEVKERISKFRAEFEGTGKRHEGTRRGVMQGMEN